MGTTPHGQYACQQVLLSGLQEDQKALNELKSLTWAATAAI